MDLTWSFPVADFDSGLFSMNNEIDGPGSRKTAAHGLGEIPFLVRVRLLILFDLPFSLI